MGSTIAAIIKTVSALLTSENSRKTVGWILTAVLSPLILLLVLLCSIGAGGAEHNTSTVYASFYGSGYSENAPVEFRSYVSDMRLAFALLDSEITSLNNQIENSLGLDPIRIKAVFFVLYFGSDVPSLYATSRFVKCFYSTEEQTRTVELEQEDGTKVEIEELYTVVIPHSPNTSYLNLTRLYGRAITDKDKSNIEHIYTLIANPGGGTVTGNYLRGEHPSIELDLSEFQDPTTKNADDLVTYVTHAWDSCWGYVWGTFGTVLTDSLLEYKTQQYPDEVGNSESFIRANWLNSRTADCVGLIKGYGWLNPETLTIDYGSNGMPDYSANQMYYSASVSGPISTMPDTPGLAVWMNGHIGVYIGNDEVIEAFNTSKGVIKTKLHEGAWTNWLQIECINYD